MAKQPRPQKPTAPDHLSATEKAVYTEVVARVHGPFNPHIMTLLEAYAIERARWQDAEAFIRENGTTVILRNDKGEPRAIVETPQLKIAERSREATITIGMRLGLEQ